eukprot:Gb_18082 [translate_table: standard]
MNDVICTYNDLYHEVEWEDRLYANWEELLEDEDQYKSGMLALKASGLHRIAAKPKVFLCKDLFTHAINFCRLEKGLLASLVGMLAIIMGSIFHDLYKMPKTDIVYTVEFVVIFLKGKDFVKEVMRGWAEDPAKIKRQSTINYLISYFIKRIRVSMEMLNRLWGKANINRVDQLWASLLGEIIVHDKKLDFVELLSYNLHQNWEIIKRGKSFFMASYIVDSCCASLRFNHSQIPKWPHSSGAPIHTLFNPLYIYKYHHFITAICEYFYPMVYRAICETEMPRLSAQVRDDLSNIGAWWFFKDHTVIQVEGVLTAPKMLPEVDDACMEEEEVEEIDEVLTRSLLRGIPTNETMILDPTKTTTDPSTSTDTPHLQLARAEAIGGVMAKPPEVTLEYEKAISSLKKVTRRRIKIGGQVPTIQTKENMLSLTRKRKRETRGKDLGDEELVADLVSIVRLANKMSEESVERMHLDLTQDRDKIMALPSMGAEIIGLIKELYRSFTRAEEARGRGKEVHQKIEASLKNIDEWNAKLATLRGVAQRNQPSSLGLMGVEDIATCESMLARTRQALKDRGTPLAVFNRQLELSA